ncbi:hypothetical protein [Chitinophaga flava]|uniref:YD repeat-containing protein n=1 Tax=Chitinophaga flava TaxID=2259036 RepID=A0A365XU09_9BACT|nr:hypothetical protein [Chitinophaga flava]RBL89842.1 hypothetical protein DF182_25505 [Chitinophaga flava]
MIFIHDNFKKVVASFWSVLLFFFVAETTVAQQTIDPNSFKNPNILSPDVANLGEFGRVPVLPFNGTVDVSIPLYTLKYRDMEVPLILLYNTRGNKVETFRSWVGLGWSLISGGVITREVNYQPDEEQLNFGKIREDREDWWRASETIDGPDEFSFNFLGHTGSFYMDRNGKWQIKSKDANSLKIDCVVADKLDANEGGPLYNVKNIITFVITTQDGTTYTFGRQAEAIEKTRSCKLTAVPEEDPFGVPLLVSNAWHLVEIKNQKGQINFKYKRGGHISARNVTEICRDPWITEMNPSIETPNEANATRYNGHYLSYLESIEAPQYCTLKFNMAESADLKYESFNFVQRFYALVSAEPGGSVTKDLFFSLGYFPLDAYNNKEKYFKLDNIKISYAGQNTEDQVKFSYIDNSTERLKLSKVTIYPQENLSEHSYSFTYNPQKLPSYLSGRVDHWGYYNGRNFYGDKLKIGIKEPPDLVAYFNSREPDPSFLQAEILNKIEYPTGGSTTFVYEPHDYSSIVMYKPMGVQGTPQKFAGGLRIKKIINIDGVTTLPLVREFFYTKDFIQGGTLSSGVCTGLPVYYESGYDRLGSSFRFCSSPNGFAGLSDGNHITYTEVVERNTDGSYKKYTYSNHDNGYLDMAPDLIKMGRSITTDVASVYTSYICSKRELERGLLLQSDVFNSDRKLLLSEINTYNSEDNKYEQFLKQKLDITSIGGATFLVTSRLFYFWPFLAKQEQVEYDKNGNRFSTVKVFDYDRENRLPRMQSQLINNDNYIITRYKYATDFIGNVVYDEMVKRNMIAPVVETIVEKKFPESLRLNTGTSSIIQPYKLSHKKTNYGLWNESKHILPISQEEGNEGSPLKTVVKFEGYDNYGNLIQSRTSKGILTSYLWGYSGLYPVAEINGLDYSRAFRVVDENILLNVNNVFSEQQIMSELDKLRSNLNAALIKTYTYRFGDGMTQTKNAQGVRTYFYYDRAHRLSMTKDNDGSIIKMYDYNYKLPSNY